MILRRVIAHFRKQEWTAIAIDFLIVVVGVFVGLQVSNWNSQRETRNLEGYYLSSLSQEIEANIEAFKNWQGIIGKRRDMAGDFVRALNAPTSTDQGLYDAGVSFLMEAWWLPHFSPTMTVFNDMNETGNLLVIRNKALRESIIALYKNYTSSAESLQVNKDWALSLDAQITYETEALRWSEGTSELFPQWTAEDSASEFRKDSAPYSRVAATYYYVHGRAMDLYAEAAAASENTLWLIKSELDE
jgi:hypothetical protein